MTNPRAALIFLRWFAAALYAGLIFYLSSLSRPLPFFEVIQKYHSDLIFHGVEYGVFGALLVRAAAVSWESSSPKMWMMIAFLIGLAYGCTDEWHQSFVPLRDASFLDAAADAAGTAIGIWIWMRSNKIKTHA